MVAPVRFGCGLGVERFERFRFSVPLVPPGRGFSTEKVFVLRSAPGKTVPTALVSGSSSVPGPPC